MIVIVILTILWIIFLLWCRIPFIQNPQISDAISLSIFLKCFQTFGKDTPWIKTKQNMLVIQVILNLTTWAKKLKEYQKHFVPKKKTLRSLRDFWYHFQLILSNKRLFWITVKIYVLSNSWTCDHSWNP